MRNLNFQIVLKTCFAVIVLLVVVADGDSLVAQTVQLPVFRTFGVRTAVSIPDGGTINLSGGGSSSYGQSSRSGFGGGRGSNRFGSRTPARLSLSAKMIRLKEFEQQVLADHAAGRLPPGRVEINGSHAVQAKADFITRHVGQ